MILANIINFFCIYKELEDIKLYVASSIYVQDEFELLTEFLTIGREFYQSEISKIDFKNIDAAEKINNWVKQKTNNKIPNLVASGDLF